MTVVVVIQSQTATQDGRFRTVILNLLYSPAKKRSGYRGCTGHSELVSRVRDHCVTSASGHWIKKLNPCPEWIYRFLWCTDWCTMIRMILEHWSRSGSSQWNAQKSRKMSYNSFRNLLPRSSKILEKNETFFLLCNSFPEEVYKKIRTVSLAFFSCLYGLQPWGKKSTAAAG